MPQRPAFVRWSDEKEARIQSRMLDVLERRFTRRIAEDLTDYVTDTVEAYRVMGYVPDLTEADVMRFAEIYRRIAIVSTRTFGRRVITQGKSAGLLLDTKEDEPGFWSSLFRRVADTWVQSEVIRQRIVSVTTTTRKRVVDAVLRGQQAGQSVNDIADGILRTTPQFSKRRAALIARTETHGAANNAMHQTAKATGLELVKKWVSVEDHRTRRIDSRDPDQFDHWAMNGQTREMDEPFEMPRLGSTEPLRIMFPGEAGHPGAATINCRCASVHRVKHF